MISQLLKYFCVALLLNVIIHPVVVALEIDPEAIGLIENTDEVDCLIAGYPDLAKWSIHGITKAPGNEPEHSIIYGAVGGVWVRKGFKVVVYNYTEFEGNWYGWYGSSGEALINDEPNNDLPFKGEPFMDGHYFDAERTFPGGESIDSWRCLREDDVPQYGL